jgi:hypothetical protein
MRKYLLLASVLIALGGVYAVAPRNVDAESETLEAPKVIVVKYDADW